MELATKPCLVLNQKSPSAIFGESFVNVIPEYFLVSEAALWTDEHESVEAVAVVSTARPVFLLVRSLLNILRVLAKPPLLDSFHHHCTSATFPLTKVIFKSL